MGNVPEHEIIVTGYAKLPGETTAQRLYTVVGVTLLVDTKTSNIMDADITLATNVARDFFKRAVVGGNMENFDSILKVFENQYWGTAKKSIITALKICLMKYKEYLKKK
ncbi:DUF3870 domain-containing protein [Thermosediminibacter oceani]|uniref:DUF3870 domain-containing protein n=1 Tax=Thermosediminibacter oceani (strain ATCC BAA-1034 / DSM 16646 / JW/IW-1228P) TaxID=555079 RepID=D9RZ14_THEOJ|nr:DUF3870 domain-containing protein [Thermosediminibacter oceani]ADL08568.1 conserved hypothetical protein [Thermosediminibacter oceani DSM 16646]